MKEEGKDTVVFTVENTVWLLLPATVVLTIFSRAAGRELKGTWPQSLEWGVKIDSIQIFVEVKHESG